VEELISSSQMLMHELDQSGFLDWRVDTKPNNGTNQTNNINVMHSNHVVTMREVPCWWVTKKWHQHWEQMRSPILDPSSARWTTFQEDKSRSQKVEEGGGLYNV
jgi:hypothetical protein